MQLYNLFECLYRRVYSLGSRRFDALEFENRFKAFWVIRSRWVSCYDYHFPDLNRGWLKSSQHDRGSLCPWFDMCNHSEDPLVRYDYSADNGMVLRAIDDIQARVNGKVGHPSIRDGPCCLVRTWKSTLQAMFVKPWQAESEILISYSSRSDDELVADYGFCLPPGENDASGLEFRLEEFQAKVLNSNDHKINFEHVRL